MARRMKSRHRPQQGPVPISKGQFAVGTWILTALFGVLSALDIASGFVAHGHLHFRPALLLMALALTVISLVLTWQWWRAKGNEHP